MQRWWWTLGMAAAVALTGCPDASNEDGGGGGKVTYDDSNPVTREQETSGKALPLQSEAQTESVRVGDRIEDSSAQVIARGGQVVQKVNVNSAKASELARVPGVGDTLAKSIVANRPYKDADELADKVPYLTERQVQAIKPYLAF